MKFVKNVKGVSMLNGMEDFFKDTNFLIGVLETKGDGLMVVDKEMNILFFNRAAEEMTGYQRDEVMGKPCAILDTDVCVLLPNSEMGKNASSLKAVLSIRDAI